jgi:hypothetical protein
MSDASTYYLHAPQLLARELFPWPIGPARRNHNTSHANALANRIYRLSRVRLEEENDTNISVPSDLKQRVEKHLTKNEAERWDDAVRSIVEEDSRDEGGLP